MKKAMLIIIAIIAAEYTFAQDLNTRIRTQANSRIEELRNNLNSLDVSKQMDSYNLALKTAQYYYINKRYLHLVQLLFDEKVDQKNAFSNGKEVSYVHLVPTGGCIILSSMLDDINTLTIKALFVKKGLKEKELRSIVTGNNLVYSQVPVSISYDTACIVLPNAFHNNETVKYIINQLTLILDRSKPQIVRSPYEETPKQRRLDLLIAGPPTVPDKLLKLTAPVQPKKYSYADILSIARKHHFIFPIDTSLKQPVGIIQEYSGIQMPHLFMYDSFDRKDKNLH